MNKTTRPIEDNEYDAIIETIRDGLWKAWFLPEDLMGLSVVLKAKRIVKDSIFVASNNMFGATRYEQPIDIMLCVSSTLADDLNVGLAGLQTEHFEEITGMSTEQICGFLKRKSTDMYLVLSISLIKRLANLLEDNGIIKIDYYNEYMQLNSIVESILALEDIDSVGNHIMLDFLKH